MKLKIVINNIWTEPQARVLFIFVVHINPTEVSNMNYNTPGSCRKCFRWINMQIGYYFWGAVQCEWIVTMTIHPYLNLKHHSQIMCYTRIQLNLLIFGRSVVVAHVEIFILNYCKSKLNSAEELLKTERSA